MKLMPGTVLMPHSVVYYKYATSKIELLGFLPSVVGFVLQYNKQFSSSLVLICQPYVGSMLPVGLNYFSSCGLLLLLFLFLSCCCCFSNILQKMQAFLRTFPCLNLCSKPCSFSYYTVFKWTNAIARVLLFFVHLPYMV